MKVNGILKKITSTARPKRGNFLIEISGQFSVTKEQLEEIKEMFFAKTNILLEYDNLDNGHFLKITNLDLQLGEKT